jgi:hypothetical protein
MTNIAKTYLDKCEDYKHGRISLNELIRFHDENRKAIIQAAKQIKQTTQRRGRTWHGLSLRRSTAGPCGLAVVHGPERVG